MVWVHLNYRFISDLFCFTIFLQVMQPGLLCERHPVFISASFLCKRCFILWFSWIKNYIYTHCVFFIYFLLYSILIHSCMTRKTSWRSTDLKRSICRCENKRILNQTAMFRYALVSFSDYRNISLQFLLLLSSTCNLDIEYQVYITS